MRPGEHPEFFRLPPPEGRSRESTIRLDGQGRFFHDGQVVDHPRLARALATWISRHPDDNRYILNNGYDWTYFEVEDVPYFVAAVSRGPAGLVLELTDGSQQPLDPAQTTCSADGNLRTRVKPDAPGGPYDAKFTRAALVDLSAEVEESGDGALRLAGVPLRLES